MLVIELPITVLDENGNKVRKQVSQEPISHDKQATEEFATKKTLNEYIDKKKLLKRDAPTHQLYNEYKKEYYLKRNDQTLYYRDD